VGLFILIGQAGEHKLFGWLAGWLGTIPKVGGWGLSPNYCSTEKATGLLDFHGTHLGQLTKPETWPKSIFVIDKKGVQGQVSTFGAKMRPQKPQKATKNNKNTTPLNKTNFQFDPKSILLMSK